MAKKTTTAPADDATAVIDRAAYYRVKASARFKLGGIGFGAGQETEVTGAILTALLASEHAAKVAGYEPI
ncbi:hypothetical protein CCR97_30355 [Rhodoplanes elegans]|uniref:Uncharacterized protein n=1 Tax=Rhodoplanes elegans TaxID=29408 RepID=A0A327JTD9_9BRAD|nr:hypothetical protein [Rhodoplanes elegans]MBK5962460.1 hypothetical protein [Rhodoplanes elegans]RAI26568.1 hypothetical protein CH338_30660 [Rhodoplanes elegans]